MKRNIEGLGTSISSGTQNKKFKIGRINEK